MKKLLNEPATWIVAYLLMALITFGNAYHRTPDEEIGYFGGEKYTIHNGIGFKVFGACFSAAAWPLYWSVQIWR